jgi:hypothetical protein
MIIYEYYDMVALCVIFPLEFFGDFVEFWFTPSQTVYWFLVLIEYAVGNIVFDASKWRL